MADNAYVMTAAHDYFAECAENYIAYIFAHAGFEVYGSGKWAADVVARDKNTGKYYRIEVRSTDRDHSPKKKGASGLAGKAELYAEVRLKGRELDFQIWELTTAGIKKGKHLHNCSYEDLRDFISTRFE
jgi:hypothetical protein